MFVCVCYSFVLLLLLGIFVLFSSYLFDELLLLLRWPKTDPAVVRTPQSRLLAPSVVTRLPFAEDVIVPHAAPFSSVSTLHTQ